MCHLLVCWIVQSDGGGVESACVAWGVSGKGKKTCVCFQRGMEYIHVHVHTASCMSAAHSV